MKQTIVASQEKPLLAYAISKLIPGVFKHPAWVLFGSREAPLTSGALQALFKEAEHLRQEHPRDACQVLLICAVHQNYSGRRGSALATLQQALDLAGSAGLEEEQLWILWGACAVCLQEGSFSPLNVFRYITFRTSLAVLTAMFFSLLLGPGL